MASALLVNEDKLNVVLGVPHTKLITRLSVRHNMDWIQSISGPAHPVYNREPEIDLQLTYFVDQMALVEKKDLLEEMDHRIGAFLTRCNGVFIHRKVEPFREQHAHIVEYILKLSSLDLYNAELEKAARQISDEQFTKALEAKLSED